MWMCNPFWFTLLIGPLLTMQLALWSSRGVAFPDWLFYRGFVWYALVFMPVPLALDVIMFLEPLGLLWLVPSEQVRALVPAYKGTRTLVEVNCEGVPQSVLQIHIFLVITSGALSAGAAGGLIEGFDMDVLKRSLALSLLGVTKAWVEHTMSANNRGYLAKKGCVAGMGEYLLDQGRMGAGLPMDAIEKGEMVKWQSPFFPTSVDQLEILNTALVRPDAKLHRALHADPPAANLRCRLRRER